MGLGLLGRGVGDAKYLASQGAELIVTDLKTEEQLRSSLDELTSFSNITYRLGQHDLADFRDRDFILKAAGVPLDSPYIEEAQKNGIPIKMSASWFAEIAGIKTIGVTGTRGKSTVTMMLFKIMKASGMKVLLGGNIRGVSTLALLPEVSNDSIALLELDSWQCQGWGEAKMSPNVAVFTTFYDDHLNYYKGDRDKYLNDKAQIFLNQKESDVLVMGEQVVQILEEFKSQIRSRVVEAKLTEFSLAIPGEHNQRNASCAFEAAKALDIDEDVARSALQTFKGVPGRLEFLREINGVKIYNDNNSTTPEATVAGLRAVGNEHVRSVVLIMGGDEKNLDMNELIAEIPKWCSAVVLFKERGTDRIREKVFKLQEQGVEVFEEEGLSATVEKASSVAKTGDIILYSPSFSSFGKYFANEFDRGDQFRDIVQEL